MKNFFSLLILTLVLFFSNFAHADSNELNEHETFKYNDVNYSIAQNIQSNFSNGISEEFKNLEMSNSEEWINVHDKEETRYAYLVPLYNSSNEVFGYSIISDIDYSVLLTSSGVNSANFVSQVKKELIKNGDNAKFIYEFPEGFYIKNDEKLIQIINGKMYEVESIFDNGIDEISFLNSTKNNISNYNHIFSELNSWEQGDFVPVYSGDKTYYGGYQDWLTNEGVSQFYADRSCGVTAASNMMYYLSENVQGKYYNLYPYSSISKENFSKFQKKVYDHLNPAWYGIPDLNTMISRVKSYATSKGVDLTEVRSSKSWNEDNVGQYVANALDDEKPVLLITWNSTIPELQNHWVTVTKIYGSSGNIKIVASNWGEKKEYDFSLWVGDSNLYKGVIYFN